jgi:hypothetical protein
VRGNFMYPILTASAGNILVDVPTR